MLRASLRKSDGDLTAPAIVAGCGDCGLHEADEIMALVDASVLRDTDEYPDARVRAEIALGRDGADRVAMVAGNFEMMNRLLDAVGVAVNPIYAPLAAEMSLTIPEHLEN